MAEFNIGGSTTGTQLQELLMCDSIAPGYIPSYQICKTIYSYHPLGAKMAEAPIKLAQSQERDIDIPGAPDRVKLAFIGQWVKDAANKHILNFVKTSRIYGIASIAVLQEGVAADKPIDYAALAASKISFNILDPLNTAGSLVLNQDPNAFDFQKHGDIRVGATVYHRSRVQVKLNEEPVYIEYTTSAFGFVGRSVYQRALFPLKTFVQTMITDDLVVLKVGVLVAKIKQATSAVSNAIYNVVGFKRNVVKEAVTGNVISIDTTEAIESLNLQNLDAPYLLARNNVLKNIATAMDAPAKFLDQETMVEGFGEGSEDAKNMARWVNSLREDMQPVYEWFDKIIQRRAWNAEFYKTIQREFPEYKGVEYEAALMEWSNAFKATWPSLLIEPDSEKAKAADIALKAVIAAIEVVGPLLDPENKAKLVEWAQDNFNSLTLLFPFPLEIDFEALMNYIPQEVAQGDAQDANKEPAEPKPFASQDAITRLVRR